MGFKELFRKSSGSAALSFYSQNDAGTGMALIEPAAPSAGRVPNALRVVAPADKEKETEKRPAAAAPAPAAIAAERIAAKAWEIWQREGRPAGRALDNWLQAERELKA